MLEDMRRLPWEAEMDGAFCFGNSFGYLNAGEAREFIASIARALKAGARFVIETGMAAESILPNRQTKMWYQVGDIHMLSENRYHPRESCLEIHYTFVQGATIETHPSCSYVLTVNEICRMHEEAGMEVTGLLGSFAGELYQLRSPRLLVVSQKRE